MYNWIKKGLILDLNKYCNESWRQTHAQVPRTLFFDDFLRIYFTCRPIADSKGMRVSYIGYIDVSKDNFVNILTISKNPVISLGNIGEFDQHGTMPAFFMRNNFDEIIMYYTGWKRLSQVPYDTAIGYAISNDNGNTFQRKYSGPIISATKNSPYVINGPSIFKQNDIYHMVYCAGQKWVIDPENNKPEIIYKISSAISNDGINWNNYKHAIIPSNSEFECQNSPTLLFINGQYHMFFCYREGIDFRNAKRGYRIGYASSTDLKTWHRDDQMAGLSVSESGWDSEMVCYPHVFELNGKIYMFYCGNNFGEKGFGYAELEM